MVRPIYLSDETLDAHDEDEERMFRGDAGGRFGRRRGVRDKSLFDDPEEEIDEDLEEEIEELTRGV